MLKELQSKIRQWTLGLESSERPLPPEVAGNPLSQYLKLYRRQHHMVTLLYRGLVIAFAVLLGLVSYLVFSSLEELGSPDWAPYALVVLDAFLLLGLIKAFEELRRYRRKNAEILDLVSEHLARDLKKLERIKSEQSQLIAQKKKIHALNEDLKAAQEDLIESADLPEHTGWDAKACPQCGLKIELLDEVCPRCFHLFGSVLPD
ncbi:MAG: hypothetical protein RRB13_09515 [bacterium]|nr:hypothetical protein [bacterium]